MDPIAVVKKLWHFKYFVLPVLLVTLIAGVYVFQFAPRSYESSMTFAIVNPKIPTEAELLNDPALGKLNSDNPYLRSSDPTLIAQVVITRLSDSATAGILAGKNLGTDYTVTRGVTGNGLLIDISAVGQSPEQSLLTLEALGSLVQSNLYDLQKVNRADDRFLFTSLVVAPPGKSAEQFSSRLRSVIVVGLAGVVLLFGAVSLAGALETRGGNRNKKKDDGASRKDSYSGNEEDVDDQGPSDSHDGPPRQMRRENARRSRENKADLVVSKKSRGDG